MAENASISNADIVSPFLKEPLLMVHWSMCHCLPFHLSPLPWFFVICLPSTWLRLTPVYVLWALYHVTVTDNTTGIELYAPHHGIKSDFRHSNWRKSPINESRKLCPHGKWLTVARIDKHLWLRPGWTMLPPGTGKCSNTKWSRCLQCMDEYAHLMSAKLHWYWVQWMEPRSSLGKVVTHRNGSISLHSTPAVRILWA